MMNYKYLKGITIVIVIVCLGVILNSCALKRAELSPDAKKYLPLAQKYAAENNLQLGDYLGKTILRAKDYSPSQSSKEPVVYEWKATNKKSKEKFVIWVGPIMPMFPQMKPHVTLGKGRYTIGGKKITESQDTKDK
jgi:hypothetical protein